MKKNAKIRLTLNRETLRHLNAEQIAAVEGGAVSERICVVTQTCFYTQCVSDTCPTRCGQPYCYHV